MFDFLRNLTKSAEEKRQEAVAAYLDEALTGRDRQQFEQEMAQDEALRHEVEQLLLIKQSLRQLPQREVPRNFILDPAKYGRPARQPWVQAYPVLRAATAMTAFFLIFAFAAGIFSGLGASESATSESAADVAQVESVEVTQVVTETLAFEAEEAADQAEEPAAEEEAMDEFAEEEIATSSEDTEEAAEEMVEGEEAAEEEAPPAPEATVVPSPAESLQEDTAEDGVTSAEPAVQPTATISPTPTVSTLPRVTPPTPLPERDMDQAEDVDDAVVDLLEEEGEADSAETTAVLPEEEVQELDGGPLFDPLLVLQIGLAVLLLLLAGLTLYARRQR